MLKLKRVDVAPAVLGADADRDEDEREVTGKRVAQDGLQNPVPGDGRDKDEKPGEPCQRQAALQRRQPLSASGTGFLGWGPVYSDCGRMSRLCDACSRTCADHPATRDTANVGGKRSFGRPIACSTPAE